MLQNSGSTVFSQGKDRAEGELCWLWSQEVSSCKRRRCRTISSHDAEAIGGFDDSARSGATKITWGGRGGYTSGCVTELLAAEFSLAAMEARSACVEGPSSLSLVGIGVWPECKVSSLN